MLRFFLKCVLFFSFICHSLDLEALTLGQFIESGSSVDSILVYRWSAQVALIETAEKEGERLTLQLPLSEYYRKKNSLKELLKKEGQDMSQYSSIWKKLLSSTLEESNQKVSWLPNLFIFKKLNISPNWKVWKITLDSPLEEARELKHFTIYTASGPDLERAGLPQNWPYWIENHDTVHKWAMFLIDAQPNT